MRTALFISPHLDDAAFSCGGTLARLAAEGWHTVLATVFTRSVPNPTGFALQCQLDKGLPDDVDYMALRREEDRKFAARAGVHELVWLDHPEAPHRSYESAPALFGDVVPGDEIWSAVADDLERLVSRQEPGAVFAPQALGGHVDHHQVVRATLKSVPPERTFWYRDLPYAIRNPDCRPSPLLPSGLVEASIEISGFLEIKLAAAAAYATQNGFQFGGKEALRNSLSRFAEEEARRVRRTGAAEVFLRTAGVGPFP
ncbi:MAG: PIG-L deacetylase family protein [Rubrobacteraceae bacterium]